jgi:hypothetical protein
LGPLGHAAGKLMVLGMGATRWFHSDAQCDSIYEFVTIRFQWDRAYAVGQGAVL